MVDVDCLPKTLFFNLFLPKIYKKHPRYLDKLIYYLKQNPKNYPKTWNKKSFELKSVFFFKVKKTSKLNSSYKTKLFDTKIGCLGGHNRCQWYFTLFIIEIRWLSLFNFKPMTKKNGKWSFEAKLIFVEISTIRGTQFL
jgi:hypothetical protein